VHRGMKKAVGLVVGGLVVVCSLVSYGFGVLTEQTWNTVVPLAAHVWDIPVATTRYTRGWFSSTAETFLALPPAAAALLEAYVSHTPTPAGTRQGLTVVHRILHGPFPVGPRLGGIISLVPVPTRIISSLAPDVTSRDGVATAALPTLQVSTIVFFHGVSQSHFVVPAFAAPSSEQTAARLISQGLHGDVTVGAHGHHITGALRAPGLQMAQEGSVLAVHDVTARTDVSTGRQQPSRSDTAVRVGSIALTHRTEAHATWAITGGAVRATTTATGETLQAVADVQLDTFQLADMPHGPGTLHLDIRRLPIAALARLLPDVVAQWQDTQDIVTLWRQLQVSGDLARLLSGIARMSPEMALTQIHLHTTDGEVRASVYMRLDGSRLRAPGSLPQLVQSIDAQAEGEAPASWVRAVIIDQVSKVMRARSTLAALLPPNALRSLAAAISDRQLHSLVEHEYLLLDGDTYKSKAQYTYGQLFVNGKPLALPLLVQ
jgi:uncharacterized protein YdgA (DUF945 family)